MNDIEKALESLKENVEKCKEYAEISKRPNSSWISTQELAISALEQQLTDTWIPLTERLPDKNGTYLVTVKNLTGYTKTDKKVFECSYCFGDWSFKGWEDNAVIAWQSLPTEYKEDTNAKA